jgi:hypothetical protein
MVGLVVVVVQARLDRQVVLLREATVAPVSYLPLQGQQCSALAVAVAMNLLGLTSVWVALAVEVMLALLELQEPPTQAVAVEVAVLTALEALGVRESLF